uniref:Uncharacterized protein LOC114342225 n=1 Tax=Diabrotica virgifera virgifera TaxID=50390 RepID=A0A6P7GYG1_DIAVI
MAEKHVIKLSSIISFFKGEEKLISRGENAVESGHVTKVGCDGKLRILRGLVHASMRDRQYKVEIYFNSEWNIESAKCSCPRGQFQCHHMAALAIFGRYNVSATDKECAWTAKKPLKEKVSKIRDIYTTKAHRSTERDANEAEINAFRRFLAIFEGAVGFTWLLSEEVSEDEIILLAIEDIIFCKDYISCSNKTQYLEGKLKVKKEIVLKVACSTIGQNKNEKWLIYKKNRLSASNFGIVLSACKRNKYSPSLFKRLAGSYYLEHIKAIQWGREHEVEGITALERALNVKVVSTGL